MLSEEDANRLGEEWIEAWNKHDLDAILSHYSDDVEFVSPFVVRVLGEPSGTVRGSEALRDYVSRGLLRFPDLHFDLGRALPGINSVTLYYKSVNDLQAAEVMELNEEGKIRRVLCHYAA